MIRDFLCFITLHDWRKHIGISHWWKCSHCGEERFSDKYPIL